MQIVFVDKKKTLQNEIKFEISLETCSENELLYLVAKIVKIPTITDSNIDVKRIVNIIGLRIECSRECLSEAMRLQIATRPKNEKENWEKHFFK